MNESNQTKQSLPKQKSFRWCLRIFFLLPLLFLFCLLIADVYVGIHSKGRLFETLEDVPHCRAAVVLGCGKTVNGRSNLFYNHRIKAAADLWAAGKIDAIVVSGDNSRKDYDEPSQMKADLIEKGVPAEYITLDYAGFRTLDSVVRADQVFDLEEYIIISQPFHCRRAIYLARKKGQSVIGYSAKDVPGSSGVKIRLREILARTKAVMDIYFSRSPKFLGQKEHVYYRDPKKT